MYISLGELFIHQQNTGCWFDRKTYTFVKTHCLPENDEGYTRYIPLFRVDQEQIENNFLMELNDKRILHKWRDFEFCFEEFAQRNDLGRRWWDYYTNAVNQIAIQWCNEHKIKYRGEYKFENK